MESIKTSMEARLMQICTQEITTTSSYEEVLWHQLLESLRDEYGIAIFNSWFAHMKLQGINYNVLTITVPSRFIRDLIIKNYFPKIREIVTEFDQNINVIEIVTKANRPTIAVSETAEASTTAINDNASEATKSTIERPQNDNVDRFNLSSHVDSQHTFANFIVGDSNKIAFATAKACAEGNKQVLSQQVLYLHSSVGMGKTHLLHAVANHIMQAQPEVKVAYMSAEKFMYHFIMSLRNNNVYDFKEELRSVDILLIDDIQFIIGKNSTQQEFANTVGALVESGKTIVVTADKAPYNLKLDDRTKSRLAGGLVAEIKPAEFDLRKKIIAAKAQLLDVSIPEDALVYIAKNISASVRELEGALNKLVTHTTLIGLDVTLAAAKEVLDDNIQAYVVKVSVEKIMEAVANYYGVTPEDIKSKGRSAKIVAPRQVTAFIAKQMTDLSLQEIGQKLGGRDHATIIYSINKLEKTLNADPNAASDVEQIMDVLGSACY
jgi:chromosomal replication initiator protein